MLKTDADNGVTYSGKNWAYTGTVKTILEQTGLFYMWGNQFTIHIDFSIINQRILNIFYESWYSSIMTRLD
jgi:hypothetical protein